MSTYTTGELAKSVGVSVRTLQYYDQKHLLKPTATTDGGRRIYTEADADTLKLILLLKSMGLKLAAIREILASDNAQPVLELLLAEQAKRLTRERDQATTQLRTVTAVQQSLTGAAGLSLKSIKDMDRLMNNQQSLKRVHGRLVAGGLLMDALEIAGLVYAWLTGNWWVFAGVMVVAIVVAAGLTRHYFQQVAYTCPHCHTTFKPRFWQAFWAGHSPRTRKLTCPHCGQTDYCVEVFAESSKLS
ncbi:MerR family transcriptional regulator [Levilactobacillus angrenensis]|uniref:MerR family transcriptional regulator n=1 Tax=Levilactobacillus angrenensis TaxID=2486020 RepID=A0ABW1U655_9LACO|nr:MerR family transcriptional regulator [Levilactobacillus angrenensis]